MFVFHIILKIAFLRKTILYFKKLRTHINNLEKFIICFSALNFNKQKTCIIMDIKLHKFENNREYGVRYGNNAEHILKI